MTIQLSLLKSNSGDLQHPEQQLIKLHRFLNRGKPKDGSGSIQIYTKKNKNYYHYCYWNGWRAANKHICGGSVGNLKVESRVKIIKQMIEREAPVAEILNMISAFK